MLEMSKRISTKFEAKRSPVQVLYGKCIADTMSLEYICSYNSRLSSVICSARQNVNHTYFKIGKLYFSPAHRSREL